MKVLVVGTGGTIVSGITTAADRMADLLSEMGIDAIRLDAGTQRRRCPNRLNAQNVAAVLADALRIFRGARRRNVDVVWYHTFGLPTLPALRSVLVALAARLAGARPVVHLHAYGLEEHLARSGRLLRGSLWLLDRCASRLVVLYDGARTALVNDAGARRVEVLENWVDVPPETGPYPQQPPFVVVFIGGLVARKGISELLDAMVLLDDDDIRLRLVGSAQEDGYADVDHLRARIGNLERRGVVAFIGELDATQVAAELDRSHALVLPSRAEGTPLAMLEAMARARSVVVGDAGNTRAVVENAECGVVLDEVSAATVAAAIASLARDTDRTRQMGKNGRRSCLLLWTPAVRRQHLQTILDDLTASRRAAS